MMPGAIPFPVLTPERARQILEHPHFGNPEHIESRKLLAVADDVTRARRWCISRHVGLPWWATRRVERMDRKELSHELTLWREYFDFDPEGGAS